jgi:hypothetical protein
MSVIVKHMAMPSCCYECKFREEYSNGSLCIAHLNKILSEKERKERLDTCPLIDSLKIIEMIDELLNYGDKLQASPIVWHTLFVIKEMLSEERK